MPSRALVKIEIGASYSLTAILILSPRYYKLVIIPNGIFRIFPTFILILLSSSYNGNDI